MDRHERRRRDRFIAWGVSPRNRGRGKRPAATCHGEARSTKPEAATDELLENQIDLIVGAFPHAEGEQPTTDCFVLWGEAFGEHFRDPLGGG